MWVKSLTIPVIIIIMRTINNLLWLKYTTIHSMGNNKSTKVFSTSTKILKILKHMN